MSRTSKALPALNHAPLLAVITLLLACAGDPDRSAAAPADTSRDPVMAPGAEAPAASTALPDEADAGGADGSAWTAGDTSVADTVAGVALLRAVRTARHDGFDRLVFEFGGGELPGYRISYIDRPVRQCGSGNTVEIAGDGWLSITLEPSDAHTQEGQPTIADRAQTPALPNVLEFRLICDFEAQVEWVAGVRSPMEYRVLTLAAPARLVVDVRHPRN